MVQILLCAPNSLKNLINKYNPINKYLFLLYIKDVKSAKPLNKFNSNNDFNEPIIPKQAFALHILDQNYRTEINLEKNVVNEESQNIRFITNF